ncbi:hypothetical protein Sme01_71110 [Sphaerisporangium melleum]|uniref:Uncharacterized protein n=1 Tax=Sphaerisporangium melleum TaxID=321316 RepID=A0A917VTR0_9ACTN|nr:hypothetical protein [Sphaerisporangium melleum]GGL16873.1 hypothetical protein GCM10007964_68620 [Sphaerisporangium melleum]GII74635.1 hypothetical protein Sme01_71110 [Sphaerisporangium melleum]
MNGWGSKFRRSLTTATTLAAACAAGAIILPAAPGVADTGYHHYQYTCQGGAFIPRSQELPIQVDVAIPKTVRVGERIAVDWTMSASPLVSSAHFAKGGRLSVTATVDVAGLWQGKLDSTGTKEQGELQAGGPLEMPTAISGSVSTIKEGKLLLTPGQLTLTFTPPASTVRVNDTDDPTAPHGGVDKTHQHGPIVYDDHGDWIYADKRESYGDFQNDLHASNKPGSFVEVKFLGDRIRYIGERVKTVGKVAIKIDDSKEPVEVIDAHDEQSPEPKPKAQQVLWDKKLDYGDHTVTFTNLAETGSIMAVDAFEFITGDLAVPPSMFTAVCSFDGTPATATVDVVAAPTPTPSPSSSGSGRVSDGDDSVRGVVVLSGGGQGHGAPTETASPTPKASKTPKASSTPQVRVTPRGGAHTGEAPDGVGAGPLIGYGTALTLASALGGLALRRRRAAHRTLAANSAVGPIDAGRGSAE